MKYSDIDFIIGTFNRDPKIEHALFKHCKQYFDDNYRGVFFVNDEESKLEIFQESFITLWEKIEHRSIYVEDGLIKGKEGTPFTSKLTTYFMSIAKNKYKEWARTKQVKMDDDSLKTKQNRIDLDEYLDDILYDNGDNAMLEIIADCIAHMSQRCYQILSMFYYENKKLDEIMLSLPSFESKDALKTEKYKCMKNLKKSANEIYAKYINA